MSLLLLCVYLRSCYPAIGPVVGYRLKLWKTWHLEFINRLSPKKIAHNRSLKVCSLNKFFSKFSFECSRFSPVVTLDQ